MSSQKHPVRERIASQIEEILHSVRPQFYEASLLMQLTLPQLRTLFFLHSKGPMRMSEISVHLCVGMPTVTSLVSRLEDKGLVVREHDSKDRRVVFCSATKLGKNEADQFWRVRKERIKKFISLLNEEEAKLVAQANEITLRAIEKWQDIYEAGSQETSPDETGNI